MKSRRELQQELDAIRALMYRTDLTAEERICTFAAVYEGHARGGRVTADELAEVTGLSVDVVERSLEWCSAEEAAAS